MAPHSEVTRLLLSRSLANYGCWVGSTAAAAGLKQHPLMLPSAAAAAAGVLATILSAGSGTVSDLGAWLLLLLPAIWPSKGVPCSHPPWPGVHHVQSHG